MSRPLTDSVSIQELQHMREEGLTNREIAERLDCNPVTIRRLIGNQPSWMRSAPGTYSARVTDVEKPIEYASAKPDDMQTEKTSVLKRLSWIEEYAGEKYRYIVQRGMGNVTMKPTFDEDLRFNKEELERFITELMDIHSML